MKIIKNMSKDIEYVLDKAEEYARNAILLKNDYPTIAQRYWTYSGTYLDIMSGLHDEIVNLINIYRKTEGEPPAPMMAIYNYLHEREMNKAVAVKKLQEMFKTGTI